MASGSTNSPPTTPPFSPPSVCGPPMTKSPVMMMSSGDSAFVASTTRRRRAALMCGAPTWRSVSSATLSPACSARQPGTARPTRLTVVEAGSSQKAHAPSSTKTASAAASAILSFDLKRRDMRAGVVGKRLGPCQSSLQKFALKAHSLKSSFPPPRRQRRARPAAAPRDHLGEDGERDLLGRDRADVEADGRAHLAQRIFREARLAQPREHDVRAAAAPYHADVVGT